MHTLTGKVSEVLYTEDGAYTVIEVNGQGKRNRELNRFSFCGTLEGGVPGAAVKLLLSIVPREQVHYKPKPKEAESTK